MNANGSHRPHLRVVGPDQQPSAQERFAAVVDQVLAPLRAVERAGGLLPTCRHLPDRRRLDQFDGRMEVVWAPSRAPHLMCAGCCDSVTAYERLVLERIDLAAAGRLRRCASCGVDAADAIVAAEVGPVLVLAWLCGPCREDLPPRPDGSTPWAG